MGHQYLKTVIDEICSNNVNYIKTLFRNNGSNFSVQDEDEFHKIISDAYCAVKLNNVMLSTETELLVRNELVNLRFFHGNANHSTKFKHIPKQHIERRVDLVLRVTAELVNQFSSVDDKFLHGLKFVAKNIRVLKRFLRSTYDRLPWEEMEFYLACFLSGHVKSSKNSWTLPVETLRQYLEIFSSCLVNENNYISTSSEKQLIQGLGSATLAEISSKILAKTPSFKDLYCDYEQMRDLHSLALINKYIDLVLTANIRKLDGKFVVLRAFQVIGEHMKDSLDSPMVSYATKERLIASLPKKARDLVIDLRDSFSHSNFLSKRLNINWTDSSVANMKNDFKKIHSSITNIIWKKKVRHIWSCLENISNLNSVSDVQNVIATMNISNFLEGSFPNSKMSIYEKLEKLINECEIKTKKKTAMEKNFFKHIKQVIVSEQIALENVGINFLSPAYILDYVIKFSHSNELSRNHLMQIKLMAEKSLSLIVPQMEFSNLEIIIQLTTDIVTNATSRLPYYQQYEMKRIAWKICCAVEVEFETTLVKWIEGWRDEVCGNKYRQYPNGTCFLANQRLVNMQSRLGDLQKYLNNKSRKQDLATSLESHRFDESSKAALEMIVLDILSILADRRKLMDNPQLLDLDSATLVGQNLRNYLAHGDVLVNVLQIDDCMDLLLNARKLVAEIIPPEKRRLGKIVQSDPLDLEDDYSKELQTISNQEALFKALNNGSLVKIKEELGKGANIKARNFQLKTAMHFASQQQNLDVVKFVIGKNIAIDAKDVNGQNALHVSAGLGRVDIVKFLISNKNIDIDDKDNKNYQTPLHLAAIKGHEAVVTFLLNQNARYEIKDKHGYSPVHYAVLYDHKSTAKVLLDREIDVDANRAYGGLTPLHIAAENGHVDLVRYLITKNAKTTTKSDKDYTPLHAAVKGDSLDVVETLILQGADVNSRTISGATPLHLAAIYSQNNILNLLIQKGAHINDMNRFSSPLILAAEHGNLGAVEKLLDNNADITLRNVFNMTPLHYAAAYGHHDIAKLLLNQKTIDLQTFDGCTALHLSSLYGHTSTVKLLVDKGADLHLTDINGCTAVHLAAEKGHPDIVTYLIDINDHLIQKTDLNFLTALHFSSLNQHKEVIRILIEKCADVNASDRFGITPLYIALGTGSLEIVELFMATAESTNTSSYSCFTPLHLAVVKGDPSVVEYVINRSICDANAQSDSGYTALHLAVLGNKKYLISLLINSGCNIYYKDNNTHSPLYYAIERNYKDIVLSLVQTVNGVTYDDIGDSLRIAICSGYDDVVKILLTKISFNINTPIENDETFLHLAVRYGRTSIVHMLLSQRVFNLNANPLFQNVSDVNACSRKGFSPLHLAASKGQLIIVKTLLKNGAKISLPTFKNSRLAIELAILNGHLNVVEKIIEFDFTKILDYNNLLHVCAEAGRLDIAKYLVSVKNADFDKLPTLRKKRSSIIKIDINNYKPVFIAAMKGHKDLVEYFLNLKPNVLQELSYTGLTLLHYAAISGKWPLAKCLIERNIDVNVTGALGVTPLKLATMANKKNMIKFLLNNGAFLDTPFNQSIVQTKILKEMKTLPEYKTSNELLTMTTALKKAIKNNIYDDVVRAVDRGAVVNAKWMNGMTPLHYASWKGYGRIVDILLENGAHPNITTKSEKWAPLHYASKFGHFDIVKKLLSNGALYNTASVSGKTPHTFAQEIDIVNLLMLIEVGFENVFINSPIEFWNALNDVNEIRAAMNALNGDGQNLITASILTGYGNTEKLKQIFQHGLLHEYELANKYSKNEQYNAALEIYQKILIKRTELFGPNNLSTIDIKERIACILSHQSNLKEALKMMKEIFQVRRVILGINHDHTLRIRTAIATVLYKQHKYLEALNTLEIVLDIRKKNIGDREIVLEIRTHIAVVLSKLENYKPALKTCNKVIKEYETTLGSMHPKTLNVQRSMGNIVSKQGDFKKAINILKTVYESQIVVLGPCHPETLRTLRDIGDANFCQSNYTKAIKVQTEVLESQKKNLEDSHPDILITRNSIANIHYSQGEMVRALVMYLEDIKKRASLLGRQHPEIIATSERIQRIRVAINLDDHIGRVPLQKRYASRGCVNLLEFGRNVGFPEDMMENFVRPLSNPTTTPAPNSSSMQVEDNVSFTEMDPIRILLKFIRKFSEEQYYPQQDVSVFDFLRLVNEALIEKLAN